MVNKLRQLNFQKAVLPSLTTFFIGLEGILLSLIGYAISLENTSEPVIGVAAMAIFETLSLIIALLVLGIKKVPNLLKKLKSKKGLFLIAATFIGTSVGNLFLFLSVTLAGPSYGVVLTALYPIFSMFLIKLSLKEKEKWQVWFGAFLTLVSGVLFIMFPIFSNGTERIDYRKILGMFFGLITGLFWALESLLLKKVLMIKKGPIFKGFEFNSVRHIFSWASTWVVLMPLMMSFGNTYSKFGEFVTNWKVLLVCLAIAINLVVLRFVHIKSFKKVGPKISALFESNNFIIPSILSYLLFLLPNGIDGKPIFEMMDWRALIILVPITIGVLMTLYYHNDNEKQMQIY